MVSSTFSHSFIDHVQFLYNEALRQLVASKGGRQGINCSVELAASAYVSAVAAVEAFINEMALSDMAKHLLKDSPLWDLDQDWVERLEIQHKLVIVPYLLFNKTFPRDTQPFQDMRLLIKIRNDLVHYKMKGQPPAYLKPLQDRGIAFPSSLPGVGYIWIYQLCTSEGIRWANNTAHDVAHSIVAFIPDESRQFLFAGLADNFTLIPEEVPRSALIQAGIDPDS